MPLVESTPAVADDCYMTAQEVAERLRITPETLANARSRGEGIPWRKIHGRVLYPLAAVIDFESRGCGGFSWSRLEAAIEEFSDLAPAARAKLVAHLKKRLA